MGRFKSGRSDREVFEEDTIGPALERAERLGGKIPPNLKKSLNKKKLKSKLKSYKSKDGLEDEMEYQMEKERYKRELEIQKRIKELK